MPMSRCLILGAMLAIPGFAQADNWPQWRGPGFNGVAVGVGFPLEWDQVKNVLWKVPLPGRSGSTPAVWEERIFVTSPGDGRNLLLCLDRGGKELWRVDLGKERPGKHRKGSGSNPSPTTDGEYVISYYKSGDLACLDFEGRVLWRHNLQQEFGEDTLWWDLGTSPVLVGDYVVVACMQSGGSYIAAFDKESGNLRWKVDRNLDAPNEASQSYTTPVPLGVGGREILAVLGADHVTAHDVEDGQELWRIDGLNPDQNGFFRSIASPVATGNRLIAPYARGELLLGIRLGDVPAGASRVAWSRKEPSADVPTPAALEGRVYVCSDRGVVSCVDAETGEVLWSQQLERHRDAYSSSPVIAEGRIYVTREDGTTFVISAEERGRVLAKNALRETILATPVLVDGTILMRTFEHLYCIGDVR